MKHTKTPDADQLVMPVIMTETHTPIPRNEYSAVTSQVRFHERRDREEAKRIGEGNFTDFNGKLPPNPGDPTYGWRLRLLHFPTRSADGRFLLRHVHYPIGFEGPQTPAEIEQEFGTPPDKPVGSNANRTPS